MRERKTDLTFLEAAKAVLEEMKQPMHFKKIAEVAIQKKYLLSNGKTPEWTMGARLSTDIKKRGSKSEFIRTDNGKYGLRRWKRTTLSMSIPLPKVSSNGPHYWLVSADRKNFKFDEQSSSFDTVGVKYRMRNTLAQVNVADKMVIYIKRAAEFAAIMKAVGEPYFDDSDRWPVGGSELSSRIATEPEIVLSDGHRVDARHLYSRLSIFNQYPEKHRTLALRNGITEISKRDFEIIEKAMNLARDNSK